MKSLLLGMVAAIGLTATANASDITYSVNIVESAFSITGTITTDGTLGSLINHDVIAYDLKVSGAPDVVCLSACTENPNGTLIPPADITGGFFNIGPDLFATKQFLTFNFAAENSNFIVLGSKTYPTAFVEFLDHQLIGDASGQPDDEGPGGILVGGLRGATYPNLGNIQPFDNTFIIGTATPIPATLPLLAGGLGLLGLLGRRKKGETVRLTVGIGG